MKLKTKKSEPEGKPKNVVILIWLFCLGIGNTWSAHVDSIVPPDSNNTSPIPHSASELPAGQNSFPQEEGSTTEEAEPAYCCYLLGILSFLALLGIALCIAYGDLKDSFFKP